MNRMNLKKMMLVVVGLLFPLALFAASQTVAKVNGVELKRSDFEQQIKQLLGQGQKDTPELQEFVKNQMIANELFFQAAIENDLEKDPAVVNQLEQARRNILIQSYLQKNVRPKKVTDEQIKKSYETIAATLGKKEYKLRLIRTENEKIAQQVEAQLKEGKSFQELAKKYSTLPSAADGGALGWVSFKSPAKEGETNGLPLSIAKFAESHQTPGAVSSILADQNQYWITQVEQVRATHIPTLKEAKPMLQNMLASQALQQAMQKLVKKLIQRANIQAN